MDTETITMDDKPKKIPGTGRGTGRARGSKNRLPSMGKNFREVLRNLIGIDDESVERLKRIDAKAVSARERIWQTVNGLRPASTAEFLAVMKFCADYGIGRPVPMKDDVTQKPSLIFTSIHGYVPWSPLAPANRVMDARSAKMNAENDEEIRLRALEKAKPPEVIEAEAKAADDGETLERVVPPPAEDPSAFR